MRWPWQRREPDAVDLAQAVLDEARGRLNEAKERHARTAAELERRLSEEAQAHDR